MHYDEAVAAFFPARPAGTPVPSAVREGSPARRLRDAAEPLATYPIWARPVNEAQAALGLDFLSGYVCGRAAALGDPTAAVVASAFAWFEPSLVGAVLAAGREAVGRDELLAVRDRETADGVAQVLAGEDLAATADLLLTAALSLPAVGRPLYAGLRERPVPEGGAGRLQRACELLREARGDAHTAVVVASGLGAVELNVLTELWLGMELGSYTATRGWSPDALAAAVRVLEDRGELAAGQLTEAGRATRAGLEAATDAAMTPAVAALGSRLDEVVGRLGAWGERCVAAGAFPADELKRAAG